MKKRQKKNKTYYDSTYLPEGFQTMKRYGAGDLYNEVELLRYLMLRALDKMNKERKRLTFKDHLDTLHAFSRASGRVAHLMEMQEKIFPPQEEFHKIITDFNNKLDETINQFVTEYEEKGEEVPEWLQEMQTQSFRRALGGLGNE